MPLCPTSNAPLQPFQLKGEVMDIDIKMDYRKKRRNRATQSCLSCHTSKRKCNRKRPCERCSQMGLTGLCIYEVDDPAMRNGGADLDETALLRNRIAELESLVRELRGKPLPRWAEPSFCEDDIRGKWHTRSVEHAETRQSSQKGTMKDKDIITTNLQNIAPTIIAPPRMESEHPTDTVSNGYQQPYYRAPSPYSPCTVDPDSVSARSYTQYLRDGNGIINHSSEESTIAHLFATSSTDVRYCQRHYPGTGVGMSDDQDYDRLSIHDPPPNSDSSPPQSSCTSTGWLRVHCVGVDLTYLNTYQTGRRMYAIR